MEIVNFLQEERIILFLLLFSRISGVMAFFPFLSHMTIPVTIKTAFAFYLTIIFFPTLTSSIEVYTATSLILGILSEFLLGFIAGLAIHLVFGSLQLAGEQISHVMGFTMANVMDPGTGAHSPVISQIFTLLAILLLLAFDGHHLMLLFVDLSVKKMTLGMFYPDASMLDYILNATSHMFMLGFVLSFPIVALSLLADIIFGMLMKTMPQFNLLVVGFPIKIFLAFMVIGTVIGPILLIFKREFLEAMNYISTLL